MHESRLSQSVDWLEPVYEDDLVVLYRADNRDVFSSLRAVDAVITDPPYGDTSLEWDRTPTTDWINWARSQTRSLWCFGSFRFWMEQQSVFKANGFRYAQEIVWEKHNGSGFNADRFKRVHELAVHWYRGDWSEVYKDPQVTLDATARAVRRRGRTAHRGEIGSKVDYETFDGGPRLQRSVIYCRSENGRAVHPTQKPLGILRPLIAYSVPSGGVVLDPFAGSGSTLLAAREIGRRAIGIEVRADYCEAAVQRLSQGVLTP